MQQMCQCNTKEVLKKKGSSLSLPEPQLQLQALATLAEVFQPTLFFQGLLLTSGKAVPGLLPYVRTQGFMTYCL